MGLVLRMRRVVETIIREVKCLQSIVNFQSDVCVNTINVVTRSTINYCHRRELRMSMMKIEEHLYAYTLRNECA